MPKRKSYTEDDMQRAIWEVNRGSLIKPTAEKYGIPRGSLQNRLYGRTQNRRQGPGTTLTDIEERILITWLKENARKGFPRRKEDIDHAVKEFLDSVPRQNPFKDNTPGRRWYELFLKRHPELAYRTPESVTSASSKVSEENIRKWFRQIKDYLEDNHYLDIMADPSRVFNGDETNFLMCPKNGKVLVERGSRNVYEADQGQAKENLTVMFSFSASGIMVPPMIIYPYRRMPAEIIASIPEGIKWDKSDSGWMTSDVFERYIQDVFHPHLVAQKVTFPVVLFIDGHRTHMTYSLSKLCNRLDIIAICLYPNATRILQPADVSVFKPLKLCWAKQVQQWRRSNVNKQFTRSEFAKVLEKTVKTTIKPEIIKNGFRACGLHPFDPNGIDYTKCLGRCHGEDNTVEDPPEKELIKIDKKEFEEIVGKNKFKKLQEHTPDLPCSTDFMALHDIYKRLSGETISAHQVTEPALPASSRDIDEFEDFDIMNLPMYTEDGNLINETTIISEEVSSELPILTLPDFLPRPQTPIRSGGRYKELASFIISSAEYQVQEEKRKEAKDKDEKQKEDRRQMREEKREAKDAEKLRKQEIQEQKRRIREENNKIKEKEKVEKAALRAKNRDEQFKKKKKQEKIRSQELKTKRKNKYNEKENVGVKKARNK